MEDRPLRQVYKHIFYRKILLSWHGNSLIAMVRLCCISLDTFVNILGIFCWSKALLLARHVAWETTQNIDHDKSQDTKTKSMVG